VNIKVALEVSSLGDKTVTKNGATVYTIGTRNANTTLRLKDGETQVLAGLISDDERKSASKLPGLGDLPLIGRLFSNQQDQKSKTEIVLAITPRIVSNIARPSAEISEYWSGTDTLISDKPVINMPASSNEPNEPLTSQERIRERVRLIRESIKSKEQPAIEQPQPEVAPEQQQQPEVPATNANPDGTAIAPS
jgi:general secretion pathway protein D